MCDVFYLRLCCMAILGLGLTACQPTVETATPPRPVWVMTVGEQASAIAPRYTGEVTSRYASSIGFRVAGKIIRREVNVGDIVKKGQAIAQLDVTDSRLNTDAALADLHAAQANLSLAKAELGRRQQLFQQQFISTSALDSYDTQVKTAQARLQQAQAQVQLNQRQGAYTQLVADRTGVIGMIQAEPGQVVAAGQTIAQIYDMQALEVHIAVPETAISTIKVGKSASIQLGDHGPHYPGEVREIAPVANTHTHAFDVRVRVRDADAQLKLGMTAYVAWQVPTAPQMRVPSTAVTRHGAQPAVWVIDAKHIAHLRPITTGPLTEAGIEVRAGLQAGEQIATIGIHTLHEGEQVQAVQPPAEMLR